jgi:hypothetical protein
MRVRLALFITLPAIAASGCANIATVQRQAPAWFEQAQREIKGEGYPDLCDVPATRAASSPKAQWDQQADTLRTDAAAVEARVAALGPILTDEQIRANAAQVRAEAGLEP